MLESGSQLGPHHPLRRFFAVLAERNFYEHLGWPDHRVIRYVADLLADFADVNRVYPFHNESGPRLTGIADLLLAAETGTSGVTERNAHRHIGDFTLFMMGLFPEHLTRLKTRLVATCSDVLIDYVKVGKRSYRLAAEFPDEAQTVEDVTLFRKLSDRFELCVAGVACIREDLRARRQGPFDRFRERLV
jgi:hypothetical protein